MGVDSEMTRSYDGTSREKPTSFPLDSKTRGVHVEMNGNLHIIRSMDTSEWQPDVLIPEIPQQARELDRCIYTGESLMNSSRALQGTSEHIPPQCIGGSQSARVA